MEDREVDQAEFAVEFTVRQERTLVFNADDLAVWCSRQARESYRKWTIDEILATLSESPESTPDDLQELLFVYTQNHVDSSSLEQEDEDLQRTHVQRIYAD